MAFCIMQQARREFVEVGKADVGIEHGCSTGDRKSVTGVCLNMSLLMPMAQRLASCTPVGVPLAASPSANE